MNNEINRRMVRNEQTAELMELYRGFVDRFVNRRDWYARQLADGSYVAVHEPLTDRLIWQHLRGEISLGVYALDAASQGRWLCLDADDEAELQQLTDLHNQLSDKGVGSLLEPSRRGGHLWLFFAEPVLGRTLRGLASALLGEESGIEVYPKQDELSGGPGSLVRLPLGVHQKDGKRYPFLAGCSLSHQLGIVQRVETVPTSFVEAAVARMEEPEPQRCCLPRIRTITSSGSPVAEIKARVDAYDFIGQFVKLGRTGRGHCPFHDDRHMSFSIRRDGNYWQCFAGCGGGDVINFWQKYRNITLTEAIRDLRRIIGG